MADGQTKPTITIEGDMRLVWALLILMGFGTCMVTNATEDMALAECYRAGFGPKECQP